MPKTCGQAVDNQWTVQCKKCVQLSTRMGAHAWQCAMVCVKAHINPHFSHQFTTRFSTPYFTVLSLLFADFSPLSTVPTIIITKEIY